MTVTTSGADDEEPPRVPRSLADAIGKAFASSSAFRQFSSAVSAAQSPVLANILKQAAAVQAAHAQTVRQQYSFKVSAAQSPVLANILKQAAAARATHAQAAGQQFISQLGAAQSSALSDLIRQLADSQVPLEAQLDASATFFGSTDVARAMREQPVDFAEHPASWLEEVQQAEAAGDEAARVVMDAVRYLLASFLLLAQQLSPSAKTIERYAGAVSAIVVLIITMGTLSSSNPKVFNELNAVLAVPLGIVGVYLGLRPRAPMSTKRKPSKPSRTSKPTSRTLRRRAQRRR